MVTVLCALLIGFGAVTPAAGQGPSPEDLRLLLEVRADVERLGREHPDGVWPGFRLETFPVLYVLPGEGTLLLGWADTLPTGFVALADAPGAGWQPEAAQGAASTGVSLGGRAAAQVVVEGGNRAALVGLSVHEAFHAYQQSVRREGRRFGEGENSFLVTRYPIFDLENETAFVMEGKALDAALAAPSDARARDLAQQFIALREARQRRLAAELAEFEVMAELNEGLAQYAAVRALYLLAAADARGRAALLAAAEEARGALGELASTGEQSFRLRFYTTGAALGLALDRLAGEGWKSRVAEDDLTLQDALAEACGYRERERALRSTAERAFGGAEVRAATATAIAGLRERLRSEAESALARPGLLVVIRDDGLAGRGIGLCGIDPQNLHQVDDGVLLHTRWLVACAGDALQAEFNVPVVQDRTAGTLRAVVGALDAVRISAAGASLPPGVAQSLTGVEDLRVEAPGLSLRAARADVELEAGRLTVRPLSGN
jgi:hypothetical protein